MAVDAFTRAYRRGVTDELGPPLSVGSPAPTRTGGSFAATGEFALHGGVVTPSGAWSSGYVVVSNGLIAEVRRTAPTGVPVLQTSGVILPGLIDLHGHPEFNVFDPWEPPRLFANRYRWRASKPYQELVRDPQNVLLTKIPPGTGLRYAEVRALVGGVTAIQGASATARKEGVEPMVRNVDLWIFGQHRARAMIDLPSSRTGRDYPRLKKILAGIEALEIDAFYLHLCEGVRGDQRSAAEFARFLDMKAATPATVVIHGSALDVAQIHELADSGCKLVWSPQSNLRLYGQTTLAAEAIKAGMPVALGADWLPSGSTSLLAEMRVARRELARQGSPIAAADLVHMVTAGAASIAGLGDHLGTLAPGRPADLVVLERHHDDLYEAVCLAGPDQVEMVLIGGDIAYGRQDWFDQLTEAPPEASPEQLIAWGKQMKLDLSFQSAPGVPVPSLTAIRTQLTTAYPPVGPIFA